MNIDLQDFRLRAATTGHLDVSTGIEMSDPKPTSTRRCELESIRAGLVQ
jgi:hypothetical protein